MERHLVWFWLTLLFLAWGFGINELSAITLLACALFFSLIFVMPIIKNHSLASTMALILAGASVTMAFESHSSPYAILILAYLAGETIVRLEKWHAVLVGAFLVMYLVIIEPFSKSFTLLLTALLTLASILGYTYWNRTKESDTRYDALLHEFRKMKLKSESDEKLARQEERTQIGREIHDRVGHKLTNLLMQLEVARMNNGGNSQEQLNMLKELARESLDETRQAVKTMDHEVIGGLPAIIRLIRKLETENFIRIHFSVRHRALSATLEVDQTVAVYRAVQEALTNVMRHGSEREVSILFESPGESIFRFEVSNPIQDELKYEEGYGLKSMRERLESVNGKLEVLIYQNRFIVRGTIPLLSKGDGLNGESAAR
ncbi:sensor histidine kinase [Aquisalibacillus elongatus]|uniref:histidine kinase n=1 Tax=Aquisalibacillus elongatus TaxID=485577 RepID=A0A3N5C558_9BACI|nr:sensor histidine kinase [Aquisalibacillus elongatus]RPF53295.1 signal transduction histidine kinase [Aquisalibacillus elongatus]